MTTIKGVDTQNYSTIEDATIEATTEAIKEVGKRYFTGHVEFACKYGLNVAILFDKLVRLHKYVQGKVDEDGNHWVRMTLEEWEEELPFWSRNTIERVIKAATEGTDKTEPVIISRTFTGRSKWYRCINERLSHDQNLSPQNGEIHHPKMGNQSPQNGVLPNSFPNSFSLSNKADPPKNTKPQETQQPKKPAPLQPSPLEEFGPLPRKLLEITGLRPSSLVNGTKMDFAGVKKMLEAENTTPEKLEEFKIWYDTGKPISLKAIVENYSLFLDGGQPRHKQWQQRGQQKNGQHRETNKTRQNGYKVSDPAAIRAEIERAKRQRKPSQA